VRKGRKSECYLRLRRLVLGSGLTLSEMDEGARRATLRLLREGGFRAANVPEPPSLIGWRSRKRTNQDQQYQPQHGNQNQNKQRHQQHHRHHQEVEEEEQGEGVVRALHMLMPQQHQHFETHHRLHHRLIDYVLSKHDQEEQARDLQRMQQLEQVATEYGELDDSDDERTEKGIESEKKESPEIGTSDSPPPVSSSSSSSSSSSTPIPDITDEKSEQYLTHHWDFLRRHQKRPSILGQEKSENGTTMADVAEGEEESSILNISSAFWSESSNAFMIDRFHDLRSALAHSSTTTAATAAEDSGNVGLVTESSVGSRQGGRGGGGIAWESCCHLSRSLVHHYNQHQLHHSSSSSIHQHHHGYQQYHQTFHSSSLSSSAAVVSDAHKGWFEAGASLREKPLPEHGHTDRPGDRTSTRNAFLEAIAKVASYTFFEGKPVSK
jgi:hypothetical protein